MRQWERAILCMLIPFGMGFIASGAHCNPEVVIGSSAWLLAITIIATRKVE